jgi:hypothetical protein
MLDVVSRTSRYQVPAFVRIRPTVKSTGLEREIAVLQLDPRLRDRVEKFPGDVDMYALQRKTQASLFTDTADRDFEFARIRTPSLHQCIKGRVMVYKDGIATGHTSGNLVCIRHEMPVHWGSKETPPRTILDTSTVIDSLPGQRHFGLTGPSRQMWVGYVEPLAGIEFSESGDSGTLVCAIHNGVKVPLGLHIGKPRTHDYYFAAFFSLESWLIQARQLGIELKF